MARTSTNMLDVVANDLAAWIDLMAGQLVEGMSMGGSAPFAAQLTEQQKLDFYTNQLFNPDGTPNLKGRADQIARLGPEAFATVYKLVVKAHPNLLVPAPPPGAVIQPSPFPTATPAGPKLPGLPASLGIPRFGAAQQAGEAALSTVSPGAGEGPLG